MNTRNDLKVARSTSNMPLYFEEYHLNEFFEIITTLSRLSVTKEDNLQIVQEKHSILLNALQFLITDSGSETPVCLNKLNCLMFNVIGSKFDMLNDQCTKILKEKWNHMPKHALRSEQEDALRQNTLNIEMLLHRLILPFTNCEILTSVEEEIQQLKIGLFENGCAGMRGLIETYETRLTDMWACMEKIQYGKLCPIKLLLAYQSIEHHFALFLNMLENVPYPDKGISVDIIETTKEMQCNARLYEMYKDIDSLDTILRSLNLAMSMDFDKEKIMGKWVIERTLQLIGEHVKSTTNSPKITKSMDSKLKNANVPLREMKLIRNNLSHSKILNLGIRKELKEPNRREYQNLMQDFQKIRSIFAKALSRKEFHLLLELANNLEENYGKEIKSQNLFEEFCAIKNRMCFKDIVKALDEFSVKLQKREKMNVIVNNINEILHFLKFQEIRRNLDELLVNVEPTFRFCAQLSQSNLSDTGNDEVFKPRTIKLMSSKYSKYLKSMFTSIPTAISIKIFSERLYDNLSSVPKSKLEQYNSFIIFARDKILPETHEKFAINGISNMFDVDLKTLLVSHELDTEDEIKSLEMQWKLLSLIHSWKQRQDLKNDIILKLQHSEFDVTTLQNLIRQLGVDENTTTELVELIDKDWKKAKEIIQKIPNHFEEFLDHLVNPNSSMLRMSLSQEELVALQGMIVSFAETNEKNNQLNNLTNDLFRKTLSALDEKISENELKQLIGKFDYSLHVHHVVSSLRVQIPASGFSVNKDEYDHLLVNLQMQEKASIEALFKGRLNSKRIQTALDRLPDNYGKVLKSFRENDQLIKNVEAFSVYARALGVSEHEIHLLIPAYKHTEFLQFESLFYNRIDALEQILYDENSDATFVDKLYRRFKYNETMKAAVEIVLLDLLNILKYLSNSLQNYNQLEKIIGVSNDALLKNDKVTKIKNMRNALAHGGLTWHDLTQVFATAMTFIQNGRLLIAMHLILETEGGQAYLCAALDSNSWDHSLISDCLLEIGVISTTIAQSNLWKDEVWKLQIKQILHNDCEFTTMPLEKSMLFKKFQEEMFDAAKRNNIPKLKYCIMRDSNVNIRNCTMWTPLHFAVTGESLEAIQHLVKHHANVNSKDIRSWTPLHLAVMKNSIDSVKILIENHAIINCHTNGNLTPLHIANITDASAIKELLCKHGATYDNNTPTSAITSHKLPTESLQGNGGNKTQHKLSRQKTLVSKDLNIEKDLLPDSEFAVDSLTMDVSRNSNEELIVIPVTDIKHNRSNHQSSVVDGDGCNTNLDIQMQAITSGALPVVNEDASASQKTLVSKDLNIEKDILPASEFAINSLIMDVSRNSNEESVAIPDTDIKHNRSNHQSSVVDGNCCNTNLDILIKAITSGALPVVKCLLNNITDINARGDDGTTPLLKAASVGDVNIVKLLLEHGADANKEDEDGTTPLISASILGYVNCVQELLLNNADIEHKDNYGHNALSFAISGEFEDIVKILVDNNASVNAENRNYKIPIHDAVFTRNSKIVQFLLDNGALVDAEKPDGETPLLAAFTNHDWPTFQILLENGGDVNAVSNHPILNCAVYSEIDEIVDLLLERGAEVNMPDVDGRTALMDAALIGRGDFVKKLLMAGALIDAKDNKCNTAISEAKRNGHHDIVNMLTAKLEVKAHETLNMKDCSESPDVDGVAHSNLDTELTGPSHVSCDLVNVVGSAQAEQQNFDLALVAVRELVWVVVQELCMQLVSMVI